MTVTFRNFDEALAIANADTRSRHPGADISKASYFYHRNSVLTASRMGATQVAKNLYNATRPDLATGAYLDELAQAHGITRNKATTSIQIEADVDVTGTGVWAAGMALTTASGLAFVTAWGGSWTAAGTETLTINSTTTGAENNLPVGAELTITAPPGGMDSTATVTAVAQIEAQDAESDNELQQRLSDFYAATATSGNEGAFWAWILDDDCGRQLDSADYPPMQEAYVYPQIRGVLTMEAVPLKRWTGMTKIPAAGAITEVETYVDTVKSIGTDFDAIVVTSQGVDVRVTLATDDGYGRDWGASATASMTSTNATHTTTRVYIDSTVATPTASGVAEGDRVVVFVGTNYYPNVRVVSAISDLANPNCYIDVTEAFVDESGNDAAPPAAVQTVRPGGPLSQACIDAVLDLFSKMTPSDTADVVRFPGVDQAHPEDLTTGMFQRAILDAADQVLDVTVNTGATTATAASLSAGVLLAYILEPDADNDWLRIEFSSLND